ncbi:hypothetical protein GBZ86_16735, partial [Clostridium tarantellae]|nr:hypothetical protein [Clostridium tarantellae]
LKNPESEKVRALEMSVKEIREAKNELIKISCDEKQRALYELRAKALKDETSALNKAKREGKEEGLKEGKEKGLKEGKEKGIKEGEKIKSLEIAKNLLDVLDDETIALKTGLTVDEINQLRK